MMDDRIYHEEIKNGGTDHFALNGLEKTQKKTKKKERSILFSSSDYRQEKEHWNRKCHLFLSALLTTLVWIIEEKFLYSYIPSIPNK